MKLILPVKSIERYVIKLDLSFEILNSIFRNIKVREEKPRFYGMLTLPLKDFVKRLSVIGVTGLIGYGIVKLNNFEIEGEILISIHKIDNIFEIDVQPLIYLSKSIDDKEHIKLITFQVIGFKISSDIVNNFKEKLIIVDEIEKNLITEVDL